MVSCISNKLLVFDLFENVRSSIEHCKQSNFDKWFTKSWYALKQIN